MTENVKLLLRNVTRNVIRIQNTFPFLLNEYFAFVRLLKIWWYVNSLQLKRQFKTDSIMTVKSEIRPETLSQNHLTIPTQEF